MLFSRKYEILRLGAYLGPCFATGKRLKNYDAVQDDPTGMVDSGITHETRPTRRSKTFVGMHLKSAVFEGIVRLVELTEVA